ncbi:MAG: adenylate/guanylate cyclase domain-containing protein [Nitrospinae bacterium]|nr:adenylate/guanylate cyclase domain-containing protein [Nitrospinota bacterium]
MNQEENKTSVPSEFADIESYLDSRAKLEAMFEEKFTKTLAVMFTDIKDSTSITEIEGDLAMRQMIKHHNDILFPLIKKHGGTLVKTIGDGTLSYFESTQECLRAAVEIQKEIDDSNLHKQTKVPILVRIGFHTGKCILEKNDVYGDVVNTAAKVQSAANPAEIYLSEAAYHALDDASEVYCRFAKSAELKGKKESVNIYKAFWNPQEIESDKVHKAEAVPQAKGMAPAMKIAVMVAAPLLAVLVLVILSRILSNTSAETDKRSITHSVEPARPSK